MSGPFITEEIPDRRAPLAAALLGAALFAVTLAGTFVYDDVAVANIVGRAELLCTLATLGALLMFIPRPLTVRRGLAISGCFFIAILSKEQGILLPFLLLAWGLLRPQRQPASPGEKRALLWLTIILSWSVAGYVIYRESNPELKLS